MGLVFTFSIPVCSINLSLLTLSLYLAKLKKCVATVPMLKVVSGLAWHTLVKTKIEFCLLTLCGYIFCEII